MSKPVPQPDGAHSQGATDRATAPPCHEPAARELSSYLDDVCECGTVRLGSPWPLGTYRRGRGVNFALFSRHATRVWLELFDHPTDPVPKRRLELCPETNRTGDVWHVWVDGLDAGQLYGFRVEGPHLPRQGDRFNPSKLLLDPYSTSVANLDRLNMNLALGYDVSSPERDLSVSNYDNAAVMAKSVFTADHFDWEEARPLKIPWSRTVIYEVHVRGFTIHPTSGARHPGTYRGILEKIPYLQSLGVTAVELMPIQEFDERENPRRNPGNDEPLSDYWGYNPIAFMAPKAAYASAGERGQQTLELKELVKALHRAGIEVILDVVFNHTAEGNELGPTLSWRGIDNRSYYMLGDDPRYYRNYSGTGNTVNVGHPVVRDLIIDALRYWVLEFHIDGFRFDLASVLGRDESGNLLADAPLLERIAEDAILRDTRIIAEAWDAAGAYQVGSFSERRWSEWNGRYRDDVRRFWRGDPGLLGDFASRITGSSDLFASSGKGPESSINFITCHDGFTLNDLVSYERKHNEANGEDNQDGSFENYSANYGVEGEALEPAIDAIRTRQIKNFLLTLLVSRGVPMFLAGDECRRTQNGNNNAYCQDNESSWFDWGLLERNAEVLRFTKGMVDFRMRHPVLSLEEFYRPGDIRWLSPSGREPDWRDAHARALGCVIFEGARDLLLLFNAGTGMAPFELPAARSGRAWLLVVDTAAEAPGDLAEPGREVALGNQRRLDVHARSSVILISG